MNFDNPVEKKTRKLAYRACDAQRMLGAFQAKGDEEYRLTIYSGGCFEVDVLEDGEEVAGAEARSESELVHVIKNFLTRWERRR